MNGLGLPRGTNAFQGVSKGISRVVQKNPEFGVGDSGFDVGLNTRLKSIRPKWRALVWGSVPVV